MPFDQDPPVPPLAPIKSVCVYCGSSNRVDDKYKHVAEQIGIALAKRHLRVVYGGGHVGLMGMVADAALNAGGEVVGIIPEHIRAKEVQHTRLTELHVVDSMHTRKRMMVERADAFVILPGGFGTLDEMFEVLTWKQLGLHNKPIIIYNQFDFWSPLVALINHIVETRFAPPDNHSYYRLAHSVDELFAALEAPADKAVDPALKWV